MSGLPAGFFAAPADARPEVRERACRGLAQLRSRAACPELLVGLEGADGEVQELAWRALQSVTGLEHPPEAGLWREALAL